MKRICKRTILGILFTVLVLTSCSNRMSNEEMKRSWWLYGSGFRIKDTLRFDDTNLKGDTIYLENKAVAIITYCGKEMPINSATLKIKSIETGEYGTYHEKRQK